MGSLLAQVTYTYKVSAGFSVAYTLLILAFVIVTYVFMAYCLMTIANRIDTPKAWFAWIPILNIWLMVDIAGRDIVWFILFLIPCVNIVIFILLWMDIAKALGFENWWGILMIIPTFNFHVMYKLAFR